MNATNQNSLDKFFAHWLGADFWQHSPAAVHIVIIAILAVAVHLVVKIIRHISEWLINKSYAKKNPLGFVAQQPKFITLTRLIVSAVTFTIYFLAVGFVLITAFHFSNAFLTTYLSSAAVVGLALSFGLQGLVQDVVTCVTLILSNTIDVGDIVDLSGTIGRVEQIGLRFTKVINFDNQEIFVPNRNIANVARFPRGGVHAYADIQIPPKADQQKVIQTIHDAVKGTWKQFGAIILAEPELGEIEVAEPGGWNFLRVQFKIWPGQTLIETTFRSQMVSAMKTFDSGYADWMIPVTYRAISSSHDKASSNVRTKN